MTDNKLGQLGILFSSKVSASLSHELNNVLAVIKESSGLLQDYLAILAQGGELNTSILERVSQRLANQVSRGQKIITRMNRFAHSGDHPRAEIDLAETVGLTVDLQHRLAAQSNADFTLEAPQKVTLTTNTFVLEDILWRALCFASPFAKSSPLSPVRISAIQDGAEIVIGGLDFSQHAEDRTFPDQEDEFILELLSGSMRVDRERGEVALTLKNL